jgi:CheY-like chemotaxis protein
LLDTAIVVTTELIELRFELRQLLRAFTQHVATGEVFLPIHRQPAERFDLTLVVQPEEIRFAEQPCVVQRRDALGVWVTMTPTNELKAFVMAQTQPHDRAVEKSANLHVSFENISELAERWEADLSGGDLFVQMSKPPQVGQPLEVNLMVPGMPAISAAARVVHRRASGPSAGAGLRFGERAAEALAPLGALVARFRQRPKHVLVIDDEVIWRQSLAYALTPLGINVRLAADGRQGMLQLIDSYFELDLVVVDLQMPQLDGAEVITRVRQLGRDRELKVYVLTSAPETAAERIAPGSANLLLSKCAPIDDITQTISAAL